MEMEEKHNPRHELLRQDTSTSWSEFPQDLLTLVFERLRFTDFVRAKSVCSSWYSNSKHCVPKKQTTPWLILFPEDRNKKSCMMFNPEEKDKLYKTQDLGLDFTKSVCVSTSGSWLLMQGDRQYSLYILNLFTQERINLPRIKSQFGTMNIRSQVFWIGNRDIQCPVFWIDEETKDYLVFWALGNTSVVYAKKGDTSWNPIPTISSCYDMVYNDHKLYFLSRSGSVTIFDFSGEIPRETFRCSVILHRFGETWRFLRIKLVVTLTGDVLMVRRRFNISSFQVYKVYSSSFFKKNGQVHSLGDEAMLFDLGITVLANDINGLKKNYIYFDGSNERDTSEVQLFNLETHKIEPLHKFDVCSRVQLSKARWFLPSF